MPMYLIDTSITAWIPVRTALWKDRIADSVEALDNLRQDIPALVPRVRAGLTHVETAIDTPPKAVLKRLSSQSILVHARQTDFLRVSATYTLDRDAFNEENPDRELDEDVFSALAAMHLGEALETLLMFSELSYPGRIITTEGVVITKQGGNARIRPKNSFFQLWFPDNEDPTWPLIATIPLENVLDWIAGTSFFTQALAVTRVERTLAACTQMIQLGPYKEGETLFRAMQALEAFYCDGSGDLRKQLAEKSSLWLGQWSEKRNIVGHLYDMRSKFVHGAAKLQYWTDHADPWEEDEKHMRSFAHSVTQATRLVISTLQKCITDKVHDVEWSYAVKASRLGT